jgi:SOS-response transcriptional repressor LexA
MNERASKKQRELLSFIDGFIKGNGYGPSYREVMRALDYKSVSTVAVHIDGLISRGFLRKRDHSARSIEVISTDVSVAPVSTAEKEIHDKLELLQKDGHEKNAEAITALVKALELLGYENDIKTTVS